MEDNARKSKDEYNLSSDVRNEEGTLREVIRDFFKGNLSRKKAMNIAIVLLAITVVCLIWAIINIKKTLGL